MRVNSRKTQRKSPKMSKFDLFLADLTPNLTFSTRHRACLSGLSTTATTSSAKSALN